MEKKVYELSQDELDVIATYMGDDIRVKLMAKESEFDNDKAVETYVKSDIIALNNLYSERGGE